MSKLWEIEQKKIGTIITLLQKWDVDRGGELADFVNNHYNIALSPNLIINMEKIAYIDSVMIGALIHQYRHIKEQGGFLYLLKPSSIIIKIINNAGLANIFPIFFSESDLRAHIDRPVS
ncbi:MAG: STAS domain-containing protein [Fibrobacteria bacterium]|nr:STAS domain-containing protein [Fibrobacteria bacterium]